MATRARMNAAVGSSGAYVGGTGKVAGPVPNVSGTGVENPYRSGRYMGIQSTTGYLMALVVAEIAALVILRRTFRHAHGG